jgi:hypothetical protein
MRAFIIRILQMAIQMLSPKKTHRDYYPANYSADDREVMDLNQVTSEVQFDPKQGLVSRKVLGTTFESTGYRHIGDGIHTFTAHGYVTPAGKERIEVFPGDRFYFTQGMEFHLLPRG